MFRKRIKKEFPAGTFIPTPARIVAILQLCLAFSIFLWYAGQPFMGDLFRIKSQMLIYEHVMGIDKNKSSEHTEKLNRNQERFENLPILLKNRLEKDYLLLQKQLSRSLSEKIQRLQSIFIYEIPPFEWGLLILSIFLPIFLLKRVEGATQASWLLPLLACFLLFDTQRQELMNLNSEEMLFPSEQEITQNYLQEPLSSDILQQREQLIRGWHLYLIQNWTKEIPSRDSQTFQLQIENGEFLFNVERIKYMKNSFEKNSQKSVLLQWFYVVWNLFFAGFITWHLKDLSSKSLNARC